MRANYRRSPLAPDVHVNINTRNINFINDYYISRNTSKEIMNVVDTWYNMKIKKVFVFRYDDGNTVYRKNMEAQQIWKLKTLCTRAFREFENRTHMETDYHPILLIFGIQQSSVQSMPSLFIKSQNSKRYYLKKTFSSIRYLVKGTCISSRALEPENELRWFITHQCQSFLTAVQQASNFQPILAKVTIKLPKKSVTTANDE